MGRGTKSRVWRVEGVFEYFTSIICSVGWGRTIYVFSRFEVAVSGVLVREENKKQKPVFYTIKMLLDAETRYSNLEKMVLALVTTKKKLMHYLESHPVTVVTNYPIR